VIKLAKTVTDLRIEDWDDRTAEQFIERLKDYKRTAEEFSGEATTDNVAETSSYALTFVDDAGNAVTKRFEKVEQSKRGKLLMNALLADIDSMGHAISEQEKRQILMEVLKKMC
jgi:leucyl-tRNA synthetase